MDHDDKEAEKAEDLSSRHRSDEEGSSTDSRKDERINEKLSVGGGGGGRGDDDDVEDTSSSSSREGTDAKEQQPHEEPPAEEEDKDDLASSSGKNNESDHSSVDKQDEERNQKASVPGVHGDEDGENSNSRLENGPAEQREDEEQPAQEDNDDASMLDDEMNKKRSVESMRDSDDELGGEDDDDNVNNRAGKGDEEEEKPDEDQEADENDGDGDDSSSSFDSSSSSSDDDDDRKRSASDNPEGLSDYELLRLERIRRNQERLSRLGLHGKEGGGVLGGAKPKKKRQRKSLDLTSQLPQRSSSRARKPINYAEPSASVASLLRKNDAKLAAAAADAKKPPPDDKTDKVNNDQKQTDGQDSKTGDDGDSKPTPSKRKENPRTTRRERFIFNEFKSIASRKKRTLRDAERNVRAAEKEVAYWTKRCSAWDKHQQRKLLQEELRRLHERQQADLGGPLKQLLQQVDKRMPELHQAAVQYDKVYEAAARAREREAKRLESEHRMKLLDALDRFPKAIKTATSLLNAVLLERAPKDPPPPRRSSRAIGDHAAAEETPAPAKKKKGRKKKVVSNPAGEDWSPPSAAASLPMDADRIESSSSSLPVKGGQEEAPKKRKKLSRNVGGWISPNFASVIDRSWLEKDVSMDKFDLLSYVPQVGDCVLYYPVGHREYLNKYPDVLGKKTRSTSRVPLWERAALEKANHNQDDNEGTGPTTTTASSWWNDEWLEGFETKFAGYPIVCRVERTHAEFPPDPFTKSVKKDEGGNVVKVSYKAPKDPGTVKRIAGTPLRLAIGLRPLTPLLPPRWVDGGPRDDDRPLSLPPPFAAVSFPSDLTPFVVPFGWAYAASHAFTLDQQVVSLTQPNVGKLRIRDLVSLGDAWGSMRLDDDDKLQIAKSLVERSSSKMSADVTLSDDLSKYPQKFPAQAAQVVVAVLTKTLQEKSRDATEHEGSPAGRVNIVDFIRSTLPLWGSAVSIPNVYNRKRICFAPWELKPPGKVRLVSAATHPSVLDDGLREKIDFVIETLINDEESSEAAAMFRSPVTEGEAPSYGCAVPVGLSLSKILGRLRGKGYRQCYYRGVESLLADVAGILDNCLLYNSPDSPVVEDAVDVVSKLKESISKVAQTHYRELTDARRIDEERRQHVLRQLAPSASDAAEGDTTQRTVVSTFKKPYSDPLDREWLLHLEQHTDRAEDADWLPQAGDEIEYSRKCHELFVKGHYPSLEAEQCVLLNDPTESSSDWIRGTVQWARPAFPKSLSKKSREDAHTFKTSAVMLAIGVKLVSSKTTGVLFWRPCILKSDCSGGREPVCRCGLSRRKSFVRPVDGSKTGVESSGGETLVSDSAGLLSTCRQEDIGLLLNLLKRRCLRQVSPSFVDPELTKVSVKQGYRPPSTKSGLRNLPKYDHLFVTGVSSLPGNGGARATTRGTPRKSLGGDPSRDRLAQCGFLPTWSHGSNAEKEKEIQNCEAFAALPQLSAEFVQIRLKNGVYRHLAAIEDDIVESFVTTVVLNLRASASRKKSPVSMKRVARAMISNKGDHQTAAKDSASANNPAFPRVAQEEAKLADRLRLVRDLYAMALVAASDTSLLALLFGLSQPVETSPDMLAVSHREQAPNGAAARRKVTELFLAIGRDRMQNTFVSSTASLADNVAAARLQLTCNGEIFGHTQTVRRFSDTAATFKGKQVKLKLVCGGKSFFIDRPFNPEAMIPAGADIRKVRQTSIKFEQSDFERNDSLVRFFFGRPGRMDPCARCQVYKRSLFACRVKKAHSNDDYDWNEAFRGVGGVDGLLRALLPAGTQSGDSNTQEQGDTAQLQSNESKTVDTGEGTGASAAGVAQPLSNGSEPGDNREGTGGLDGNQAEVATKVAKEEEIVDPREFRAKAEGVLVSAREMQREAAQFAQAPDRLSKEFIADSFPIDSDDGHYVYCVVCGMSGDLLCCDGCANVLHSQCIGLTDVPDGDWFCEECELGGRKAAGRAEEDTKEKRLPTNSQNATKGPSSQPISTTNCQLNGRLPFGRVEFSEDRSNEVVSNILLLRESRPEYQKRKAATNGEAAQDDSSDESDDRSSSSDESSVEDPNARYRLRKRIRRSSIGDASATAEDHKPPAKKPRGRPRKDAPTPQPPSPKRPRGRPRKGQSPKQPVQQQKSSKRPRGRPRKNPLPKDEDEPAQSSPKLPRGRPRKKKPAPIIKRRSPGRPRKRPAKEESLDESSDDEDNKSHNSESSSSSAAASADKKRSSVASVSEELLDESGKVPPKQDDEESSSSEQSARLTSKSPPMSRKYIKKGVPPKQLRNGEQEEDSNDQETEPDEEDDSNDQEQEQQDDDVSTSSSSSPSPPPAKKQKKRRAVVSYVQDLTIVEEPPSFVGRSGRASRPPDRFAGPGHFV